MIISGNDYVECISAYKYLWMQENLDLNFAAKEIAKSAYRAIFCKFRSVGGT